MVNNWICWQNWHKYLPPFVLPATKEWYPLDATDDISVSFSQDWDGLGNHFWFGLAKSVIWVLPVTECLMMSGWEIKWYRLVLTSRGFLGVIFPRRNVLRRKSESVLFSWEQRPSYRLCPIKYQTNCLFDEMFFEEAAQIEWLLERLKNVRHSFWALKKECSFRAELKLSVRILIWI